VSFLDEKEIVMNTRTKRLFKLERFVTTMVMLSISFFVYGSDKVDANVSTYPSLTLVAFHSIDREGPTGYDIWVIDPNDPSNINQLTDTDEDDLFALWSPDGSKIVFTRHKPPFVGHDEDASLWIMNWDGSNQRQITPYHNVGGGSLIPYFWVDAADGERIYYYKDFGLSGLYWVYAHLEVGQPENPVTSGIPIAQPDISPDGTTLAHIWGARLYLSDFQVGAGTTAISNTRLIDSIGGSLSNPRWAPDGSQLSFVDWSKSAQIFSVEVVPPNTIPSQTPSQITTFGKHTPYSWSPDSNWMVVDLNRELVVIQSDGSGTHEPLTNDSILMKVLE